MRIGLQVPSFTWGSGEDALGETFAAVAKRTEDAGFYSLWVMDHFFQIPGVGKPEEPMLEGYTALGFAAAHTSRIKLGTMVTGNTYRNPGAREAGDDARRALRRPRVLRHRRGLVSAGARWPRRPLRHVD